MKRIIAIIMMLLTMSACSVQQQETNTEISYDGVTYTLSSDWAFDKSDLSFSNANNNDAYYTIVEEYYDASGVSSYSSIDERLATFAPDGSDGFDIEKIEINGESALKVAEPVNEIIDYHVFFYANGKEHIINYTTDFEKDTIADYTEEFLNSISW